MKCERGKDKCEEHGTGGMRADEVGMLNINHLMAGSRKESGYFQEAGHHWTLSASDNIQHSGRRRGLGGGGQGNGGKERYALRFRLQKKVSPPLERKSHNGISDGKNVFFTDESKIERAQPNVKDDKWRSA